MLDITYIGSGNTIPGWPENNTVDGLIDALSRWPLDSRLDYSNDPQFQPDPLRAPFRGPARRYNGAVFDAKLDHKVYANDGAPIYPDAPNAVSYCGNFIGYSFGFSLSTDDTEVIYRIDSAIAKNLATA
jgi:hypothetical protein